MKYLLITILFLQFFSGFSQKQKETKDTLFHDIELVKPEIDFFTLDGGYYSEFLSFSPYKTYFSAIIKNNGSFVEENVIVSILIEDYEESFLLIDTIQSLSPGEQDTILVDSITFINYWHDRLAVFTLEYDSLMFDVANNQCDTLNINYGGGEFDAYFIRTDNYNSSIGSVEFPGFSEGGILIGSKYYINDVYFWDPDFYFFIDSGSVLGTTIIGYLLDEQGGIICEGEYDIGSGPSFGWDNFSLGCIEYSIEGMRNIYVVAEFYTFDDSLFIGADTSDHCEPEKYSLLGQRSGDSIIWSHLDRMPLIGIAFIAASVDQIVPENINIYPNPAFENIFIENAKGAIARVYDIFGRQVFSQPCFSDKQNINVSGLKNGVYTLHFLEMGIIKRFVVVKQ